jgi:hypothetical protein
MQVSEYSRVAHPRQAPEHRRCSQGLLTGHHAANGRGGAPRAARLRAERADRRACTPPPPPPLLEDVPIRQATRLTTGLLAHPHLWRIRRTLARAARPRGPASGACRTAATHDRRPRRFAWTREPPLVCLFVRRWRRWCSRPTASRPPRPMARSSHAPPPCPEQLGIFVPQGMAVPMWDGCARLGLTCCDFLGSAWSSGLISGPARCAISMLGRRLKRTLPAHWGPVPAPAPPGSFWHRDPASPRISPSVRVPFPQCLLGPWALLRQQSPAVSHAQPTTSSTRGPRRGGTESGRFEKHIRSPGRQSLLRDGRTRPGPSPLVRGCKKKTSSIKINTTRFRSPVRSLTGPGPCKDLRPQSDVGLGLLCAPVGPVTFVSRSGAASKVT